MRIAVLQGTGRPNSRTEKTTGFVIGEMKKIGYEPIWVKPEEHLKEPRTLRSGKETEATLWSDIMNSSSGLVIVTPEYNHGYPGELKLMLDQLYEEYDGKPVLICAVSDGFISGARVVENLLPVLVTLGLWPLKKGVYFQKTNDEFGDDDKRRLSDALKTMDLRLQKLRQLDKT